jgi:putative transposase
MVLETVGRTCTQSSFIHPKECCDLAVAALDQHVSIPIHGSLTQTTVFQTLLAMAVMQQSVHSISTLLEKSPCETSLRHHLAKLRMDDLEAMNTAILTHRISSVLKPGEAYTFAIDYTNDPYYGGVSPENEGYIIRSQLKKSTNDFYSYVTISAITQNRQVTLAVYPVTKGTSKIAYISRCLDAITTTGLRIQALCLDREFFTRKVIDFLTTVKVPFILPVRKHSRAMKQLLIGTKARFGEYIMRGKPPLFLKIAITVKYAKGKRGKHGVENLGYVVHGIPWKPQRIHEIYRSRFAIESSYRMRNLVKPRTSTRNPVFRYLFAIIAFLLKNLWMTILWTRFSPVKQGSRTIEMGEFRFDQFTLLIEEAVRVTLKIVRKIPALRKPG